MKPTNIKIDELEFTFQAVLVDRTLYISGQLGMDPQTMDFVEGGVEEQAIQAQYIYQDSKLLKVS